MKTFLKKPVVIISLLIVAGSIVGIYKLSSGGGQPAYDFTIAAKSDLVQKVLVTGRVQPAQKVDLAFQKNGKVARVRVDIGDIVVVGQQLATLDNTDDQAQLAQAEARLKGEQATLEELKQGTRPEEIAVQQQKVQAARITLEESKKTLLATLRDAYTKAEDAVRNKADQLFTNPESTNPKLKSELNAGSNLEYRTRDERLIIQQKLYTWKSNLDAATFDSDFSTLLDEANQNLQQVGNFLEDLAAILNQASTSSNLSQTTLDGWKSNVSSARTAVASATSSVATSGEKVRNAAADIDVQETQLTLELAGSTPEAIATEEAKVEELKASVQLYQAELAKTVIISPINGTVAKQDAKIGQTVSASTNLISLISNSQFEIEANVPEADIAKISVGNAATITLDAYGRDTIFNATVGKVDPAEIIIDGVPTYKITLQFAQEDARIRSGMTANIEITTASAQQVIALPQRAIIRKDNKKYVQVVKQNGQVQETEVETGLQGSDGTIEVTKGVQVGDRIITFIPK